MPSPTRTITIEGRNIHDIASFYDEINRVFMMGENWTLGPSLDALNDLLFGGFGALNGAEPALLVWRDMEHARRALGLDATRRYYEAKLSEPQRYDVARAKEELRRLEEGVGPTYFEIVLDVLSDHPNIQLVPA